MVGSLNQERPRADLTDVLLVDPSLFTGPYDAALSAGLEAAGAVPRWATRALRVGEEDDLGELRRLPIFYPFTDGPRRRVGGYWRSLKGIEHMVGMRSLIRRARSYDCVHFQWAVLPTIDERAINQIRRGRPVVLTVHDVTPFNGKAVARAQVNGFHHLLHSVDRLIVHTTGGRDTLIERGLSPEAIAVVPHGLLGSPAGSAKPASSAQKAADRRWRVVQFGKIQDYKGVDVLVEALGLMTPAERARLRVTVAGDPMIDLAPVRVRAEQLGIDAMTLEVRPHRHSDTEMEAVLADADAFVFPYRAIEASGVLFLVARRMKWIVASDLGAFRSMIGHDDGAGTLVEPGNAIALAASLVGSIGRVPTRAAGADVPDWPEIGAMTRAVYADAAAAWRARAV